MKISILCAAIAGLVINSASAHTINVLTTNANRTHSEFHTSDGTLIPVGNRIMVGTFDTSGHASAQAYFDAAGTDIAAIMDKFRSISARYIMSSLGDRDWQFGLVTALQE
jgi:hypothetical protein